MFLFRRSSIIGQSLVEVLIGSAVGAIFMLGAVFVIAPSLTINKQTAQIQGKAELANEMASDVRAWAKGNWNNILALPTGATSTYYLDTSASPFMAVTSTEETISLGASTYQRYFYVSDAYRDVTGNLTTTASGNHYDPSTKLVTVVVNLVDTTVNPIQIATTAVGNNPRSIYVSGHYAYVSNNAAGTISVVDISNPFAPNQVGTTSVGNSPISIYVSGHYAYVANATDDTISVVDVSNPSAPSQIATAAVGRSPFSISVSGNYAYVANYLANTISVVDVSNPSAPSQIATAVVGSGPAFVFTSGSYAYVANSAANTISVVDISNPFAPSRVGTASVGSVPGSIYVSGNYAYVANVGAKNISVVDISNPFAPSQVATAALGNHPASIYVSGHYAYTASSASSIISVIDISNPLFPSEVTEAALGTSPISIYVVGRYAYVANAGSNTISVDDISGVRTSPTIVNFYLTRNGSNNFNQASWAGGGGQNTPITFVGNKFSTATNTTITPSGTIRLWNGYNATVVLGQFDFTSAAPQTAQNGMNADNCAAYDPNAQRLFVGDVNNNRVLVFDARTSTIATGENASYVLGQPDFSSAGNQTTQNGLDSPYGCALDVASNRLFVVDGKNNRVMVFNVATSTIATGENATYVIGQAGFTSSTAQTTQNGFSNPDAVIVDAATNRLFVADQNNYRILSFDIATATIANGENALNVLGQADFTSGGQPFSEHAWNINGPTGLAFDQSTNRLFATDLTYSRVLVFDVSTSTITNQEDAINVIGQSGFDSLLWGTTQNRFLLVDGVTFDDSTNRIFVSDVGNNRIMVFDVSTSTIANGENALNVIGQADFTTGTPHTTQSGLKSPAQPAFDSNNNRLFAVDAGNNRVLQFTTANYAATGTLDSATFDTAANAGVQLNSFTWQGSTPFSSNVGFQFAASNSSSGPWNFLGPDGTGNTYFSGAAGTPINLVSTTNGYQLVSGYRYFRYRAMLFSDPTFSYGPTITQFSLNWSP